MKKNIRKIPKEILIKLQQIKTDDIVAACSAKFKASELMAGLLSHLNIELTSEGLKAPSLIIPPSGRGKYSRINVDGEIIIRRDLPLETHYHTVEAPNWGDPTNGYHDVDLPYAAYPKEFNPPREIDIQIHPMSTTPGLSKYIISFRVNDILRKGSKKFKEHLLENLNLLQENIGSCGIEESSTSLDKYIKSLHLSWEILPPGTREEAIERLFHNRQVSSEARDVAADRYNFFMTLNPYRLVYGKSGFLRYFGALISDKLVVFENIEYGNAIYIMFENWQELSKKTRIDLLRGKYGSSFIRILHQKGWKTEVRDVVKSRKN